MNKNDFTVGILTLGCKVNQYESEAIAEMLEKNGFSVQDHAKMCDAYIINTCTVTGESDRKARQFIRRACRENPLAYILVTGCLSQTQPQNIAEIQGIDYICGNTDKLSVVSALISLVKRGKKNEKPEIYVKNIDESPFERMQIEKFDRTRAYIKIEDGCESRCTYCIIPSARGRIRSKPLSDVVDEVSRFVKNGCKEVVLTGIETASYGKDLKNVTLAELLGEVEKIEGDFTVRLGSLDPSSMNESFTEKIKELKKLAPHFHVSMQSGSDSVLRAMKRKYNSEQAMRNIEILRESIPGVRFTTDMIVGFPGESEENFAETLEFAKRANFLMMHVFPYSARKGTPAAEMGNQISQEIKKERSARLIALGKELRHAEFDKILSENAEHTVLFETCDGKYAHGHTRDFLEVSVKSPEPLHGEVRKVKLISHNGDCFLAEILDK